MGPFINWGFMHRFNIDTLAKPRWGVEGWVWGILLCENTGQSLSLSFTFSLSLHSP